jgi:hypothetical protein
MNAVSLYKLAAESWDRGIPEVDPAMQPSSSAVDLDEYRLTQISALVLQEKEALKNAPKLRQKLSAKIFNFALSHPEVALKAYKICTQIFSSDAQAATSVNKTFTLTFPSADSQTPHSILLPEYYKQTLSNESAFFHALFQRGYKEASLDKIELQDIDYERFKFILKLLSGETEDLDNMQLSELAELFPLLIRLDMRQTAIPLVRNAFIEKLQDLKYTQEECDALMQIGEAYTEELADPEIQKAIDAYQNEYIRNCKTVDQLIEFTKKHGKNLKNFRMPPRLLEFQQIRRDTPEEAVRACTKKMIAVLQNCPHLTELSLLGLPILLVNDTLFASLSHLKLQTLNAGVVYAQHVPSILNLGTLQTLVISIDELQGGPCLKNIDSKLPRLKTLNIYRVHPEDAQHLAKLHNLQHLSLREAIDLNRWTPKDLNFLSQLTHLKTLILINVSINKKTFNCISQIHDLNKLELEETTFTEKKALASLKNLVNLRSLSLIRVHDLRDEQCIFISELDNLEELWLIACDQLTDECFTNISKINKLKILNLELPIMITDLKSLTSIKSLVSLYLKFNNMKSQCLLDIGKLVGLKELKLGPVDLDSDCFKQFALLNNLQVLDVNVCSVSSSEILRLENLTKLQKFLCQNIFKSPYDYINCLQFSYSLKNKTFYYSIRDDFVAHLKYKRDFTDTDAHNYITQIHEHLIEYPDQKIKKAFNKMQRKYNSKFTQSADKLDAFTVSYGPSLNILSIPIKSRGGFADFLSVMQAIGDCPNLTELILTLPPQVAYPELISHLFRSVGHLKNLHTLTLKNCQNLSSQSLTHLSQLPVLHLELSEAVHLSDNDLSHFSGMTNLHSLKFTECPQLSSAGLKHLAKLHNLLEFEYPAQTLDQRLSGLTQAIQLDLPALCKPFRKAILHWIKALFLKESAFRTLAPVVAYLKEHPDEEIQKAVIEYQNKFLEQFSTLEEIEEFARKNGDLLLSLTLKQFDSQTDAQIVSLMRSCPHLVALSIETELSSQAFEPIPALQNLQSLTLNGCRKLSHDNVAQLAHLSNLQELSLSNANLKNCADALVKLPRLRTLKLDTSSKLLPIAFTAEDYQILAKYPNLQHFKYNFATLEELFTCLEGSYLINAPENCVYNFARRYIVQSLKESNEYDAKDEALVNRLKPHLKQFPDAVLEESLQSYVQKRIASTTTGTYTTSSQTSDQ